MFVGGQIRFVVFSGRKSAFDVFFQSSAQVFSVFGWFLLHFDVDSKKYGRQVVGLEGSAFELSPSQDALQVSQISRASKEYHLNEQSNAAAGVTNEGHATEMPDVALELLQNAVDASCLSCAMHLHHTTFSFSHYGSRPFSLVDLTSITSYGASSKVNGALSDAAAPATRA